MQKNWFSVDPEGLRKLIEHKGRFFVIAELWSNALDEATSRVEIKLESIEGSRGRANLTVIDDNPDGFKDITHAYTLYAESAKKSDPSKRGRFNRGEKVVLALCEEASIISMEHGVVFNANGTRTLTKKRTKSGTIFSARIRMTKEQISEMSENIHKLIVPENVTTVYNGVVLQARKPKRIYNDTLPTVISNTEGHLTNTIRKTQIEIHTVRDGEEAFIYEMGVPVVESGMKYHVNVMQKVPLNEDRDNVTPAYFRLLCASVVEQMYDDLEAEQTSQSWVSIALEQDNIDADAVRAITTKRFGDKIVAFNPNDAEANRKAVAAGYSFLYGTSLSSAAYQNVKSAVNLKSSSAMFPTLKPFSDDPNAPAAEIIPEADWSDGMREMADFFVKCFDALYDTNLNLVIYKKFSASMFYRHAGFLEFSPQIGFNFIGLGGKKFFDNWRENLPSVISFMIHEFSHHVVTVNGTRGDNDSHHVTEEFEKAQSKVGGKIADLLVRRPDLVHSLTSA